MNLCSVFEIEFGFDIENEESLLRRSWFIDSNE